MNSFHVVLCNGRKQFGRKSHTPHIQKAGANLYSFVRRQKRLRSCCLRLDLLILYDKQQERDFLLLRRRRRQHSAQQPTCVCSSFASTIHTHMLLLLCVCVKWKTHFPKPPPLFFYTFAVHTHTHTTTSSPSSYSPLPLCLEKLLHTHTHTGALCRRLCVYATLPFSSILSLSLFSETPEVRPIW